MGTSLPRSTQKTSLQEASSTVIKRRVRTSLCMRYGRHSDTAANDKKKKAHDKEKNSDGRMHERAELYYIYRISRIFCNAYYLLYH